MYSYEFEEKSVESSSSSDGKVILGGPLLEIPYLNIHFLQDFLEAYQPLMDRIEAQTKAYSDLQLTPVEVKAIQQELMPLGICNALPDDKGFQKTALGNMLEKIIAQKTPQSRSVLGFFLEAKVYEYLNREPWEDYLKVRASYRFDSKEVAIPENKLAEIDVLLGDFEKDWIAVEVKSYSHIISRNNKLPGQIEKLLFTWQSFNYKAPKEYHLVLYKRPFHDLYFQKCLKALKECWEQLAAQAIPFRVFYFNLDLSSEDLLTSKENPYAQKLMPRKLTRDKARYKRGTQSQYNQYFLIEELPLSI